MDFPSAIALLSQVHDFEVQRLQARIAELEPETWATAQGTLKLDVKALTRSGNFDQAPKNCVSQRSPLPMSTGQLEPELELEAVHEDPWISLIDAQSQVVDRWSALVHPLLCGNVMIDLRAGWSTLCDQGPGDRNAETQAHDVSDERTIKSNSISASRSNSVGASHEVAKKHRERDVSLLKKTFGATYVQSSTDSIKALQTQLPRFTETFLIHPSSKIRLFWVLSCIVVFMYEIFMVTMVPFGITGSGWARDIDFSLAIFWSADIFVNFISGVYVQGRVEMKFLIVARIYLRGWFCFDIFIVTMQWFAMSSVTVGRVGVTAMVVKVARFLRLLRLARISSWLQTEEIVSSALGPKAFGILNSLLFGNKVLKFASFAFLYLHCIACLWYEIGLAKDGWVSLHTDLLKGTVLHDYLVAMHWSLSQFQGNIDLDPGPSTAGRAFACVSSAVSIVCLALFLGNLTELLVSLSEERKRRDHEMRAMNSFLHRHALPPNLLARATHYSHTRQQEHTTYLKDARDEKALQLFPPRMREEMRAELVWREFSALGIFVYLKHVHSKVLVAVCGSAVTNKILLRDEDLFVAPEVARYLHLVVTGEMVYNTIMLKYLFDPRSSLVHRLSSYDDSQAVRTASEQSENAAASYIANEINSKRFSIRRIHKGDFVNEAALWIQFAHEGSLSCTSHGHCFLLDSESFTETVALHTLPHSTLQGHARHFLDWVKRIRSELQIYMYMELIDTKMILTAERRGLEYLYDYELGSGKSRVGAFGARGRSTGKSSLF